MLPISFFVFFLVQSSFANVEDSYHDSPESYNYYPDDLLDLEDNEIEKRKDQFLRFGRSDGNYDEYEEEGEGPTLGKKNLKNDHFIRFGRSGHDRCLRFGGEEKRAHDKGNYLRFGRSILGEASHQTRSKRETRPPPPPEKVPKRTDAFLRFGKSSNFMRFGRNHQNLPLTYTKADDRLVLANSMGNDHIPPRSFDELKIPVNSPLALLLAQLMARRQEQGERWETSL